MSRWTAKMYDQDDPDIFHYRDIVWAAEECERQRSGEKSVAHLINALGYTRASLVGRDLNANDIAFLGYLVEPKKNPPPKADPSKLWRQVNVTIGGIVRLPDASALDRLMKHLVNAWAEDVLSADEWYKEFEEIHPFVDGNGRVGSLLWNLHRGTIESPEDPPDFWSESNKAAAGQILLDARRK